MLESLHNVKIEVRREKVSVDDLKPTQPKIYADELEGRIYELERGLAEPLIVLEKPNKKLLIDGHHRVVAAKKLGINEIDAFILKLERDVPLGIEKTAELINLKSMEDIKIIDDLHHPLIKLTKGMPRRR
jgi:IMP dehydrogenase